MASFDILHVEHNNSSSGSFQSGEYSFLPEVSVRPVQNGISSHTEYLNLTNMPSVLSTDSSDASMDAIRSHLNEVVQVNQSLQMSLNKENESLRDQWATISAWRERMLQSQNQQLQSLKQAKDDVALLKEENNALQGQVSSLEKECQDLKNRESCNNCKSLETIMQNLQQEKASAEKVKKILVGELQDKSKIQEQLRINLGEIHQYLNNLLSARKISRKEREELNGVIQSLTAHIITLGDGFHANVQTDEETGYVVVNRNYHLGDEILLQNSNEVENLKKELEEKNEELDKLRKKDREMLEKMENYSERIQECENLLQSRNEELSTQPDIESSLNGKYKERCESLQQQVFDLEKKLEKARLTDDESIYTLREEAKNLQDILKLEQRSNQQDKEKLAEVMEKCEKLQVDYDRVTQLLEIHMKDEKKMTEEQSIQRESLAKSHMEELDHLTAQLFQIQDELSEKREEGEKLKEELATLREAAEDIPALKAQIKAYKQDLEHAVLTRDTAHTEIEKLEKELRRYKRKDSDSASFSSKKSTGSQMENADEGSIVVQSCPVCLMGFNNLIALENHVDRCLEIQGGSKQ